MIYAAFTFWLFMILFTGLGIYRLWAVLLRQRWVNWILLPGTFVSEVGYIIGCLVTGGEISRAKIVPDGGKGGGGDSDGEPTTEDTPRFKFIGRLVSALLSLVLVFTAIVMLYSKLESPVIENFEMKILLKQLPKELPDSMSSFWDQARDQIDFLEGMCQSVRSLDWKNWRVPLFIYLTICLSVRLAPVGRDLRWVLGAMIAVAGGIALAGVISKDFDGLIKDNEIWYLLTYIWTLLIMLMAVTGLTHAAVAFVRMMRGKEKKQYKAKK